MVDQTVQVKGGLSAHAAVQPVPALNVPPVFRRRYVPWYLQRYLTTWLTGLTGWSLPPCTHHGQTAKQRKGRVEIGIRCMVEIVDSIADRVLRVGH